MRFQFFKLMRGLYGALFCLQLALCMTGLSQTNAPFDLKDGDRVLFIGDTFFEREVDYGYIETRLTAAFPERNVIFRNLGWAADTPMGRSRASFDWDKPETEWLKRVKEQVGLVKPTVAFLSYGMTAALEDSEAGISKFKTDMGRLMDAIEEVSGQKVRFVLLGPIADEQREGEANEQDRILKLYDEALKELAGNRGARFVGLMKMWSELEGKTNQLNHIRTDDGIHLNDLGYNFVAGLIEKNLLGSSKDMPNAACENLRSAIRKKNELFFYRWRPSNWTYLLGFRKNEQGRNAVEIPQFDPLVAGWEARIAKLRDLKHQDPATVREVNALLSEEKQPDKAVRSLPVPGFDVADGFEVNLWAEDPLLHKPIEMNWDAQGRLWIASSEVYPQIKPGQPATDRIVVLEDTNGDGKADKSTVFAEGLLIPTGVLPDSNGGCYVAASHQLLYFKDTDGDGRADEKQIVLSSFGTEDTHHNLHTLRWGYDGHIYMNQSIYTHSHIETPHGVVRLNSGGIWRFDPHTYRLEVFTKGGCNPWGHHWDQWGNDFFTDGAGFKGIYDAMEGATYFTYADMRREAESITPGNWPKFASLELVHSQNFPDDWQGDAITCDFRAHRVVRFKLEENGSTFAGKEMPDLLRSTNVSFRPIDVRFGPDGALYIADWSNPIIQHGEVDFRDPRRDKEHGRIWRVKAKGRPLAKRESLTRLKINELLDRTLSKNTWEQESARRVAAINLHTLTPDKSADVVRNWEAKQTDERAALETLWLDEATGLYSYEPIKKVLVSTDPRLRIAGARFLANHVADVTNTIDELERLIADMSPRVRLEALRALAKIPSAKSAGLALSVLGRPMDPTLDYALWLTINDLAEPWITAVQSGAWKPEGHENELEFALKAIKPEQSSRVLGQILATHPLTRRGDGPWIELIGRAGTPKELQQLYDQVLQRGFDKPPAARAVAALNEASRLRNARPASGLDRIDLLIGAPDPIRSEAIRLAGTWKTGSLPRLMSIAGGKTTPAGTRQITFDTLREIGGKGAIETLASLTTPDKDAAIRRQAVVALAALDLSRAISRAVEIARATTDEAGALELWRGVLSVKGAGAALRDALPEKSLAESTARAGMRAAREGGRDDVNLVAAFAKAGGLAADTQALTADVIKELADNALARGNPARGEMVFRRQTLACMTCHSIGGAGGRVGPDLTSIGASAPVDYLVESLLLPGAKIKEGYHALNIETKDGQSLTGTLARETPDEIVLRNPAGAEIRVAKNNVESRQNSSLSLMPVGLLDSVSEQDKLDLVAFLSRLGKPGEFDASKGGIARKWRIYTFTHTDQQAGKVGEIWRKPLDDPMWLPTYSLASGSLTRAVLEETEKRDFWSGTLAVYAATEMQVAKAGPIRLILEGSAGEIWIDGRKAGGVGSSSLDLSAGTHRVLVRIDPQNVPDYVRLESPDAIFLAN